VTHLYCFSLKPVQTSINQVEYDCPFNEQRFVPSSFKVFKGDEYFQFFFLENMNVGFVSENHTWGSWSEVLCSSRA
jgi:hypothetical protein